ncbi:Protein of unknown function [Gryllus bimaculatus]|nr:Protein of unknown function [Gryllus bimaculatus]
MCVIFCKVNFLVKEFSHEALLLELALISLISIFVDVSSESKLLRTDSVSKGCFSTSDVMMGKFLARCRMFLIMSRARRSARILPSDDTFELEDGAFEAFVLVEDGGNGGGGGVSRGEREIFALVSLRDVHSGVKSGVVTGLPMCDIDGVIAVGFCNEFYIDISIRRIEVSIARLRSTLHKRNKHCLNSVKEIEMVSFHVDIYLL